jgi:hypothetical protein
VVPHAPGRDDDADREPRGDQVEEQGQLFLAQRLDLVVAGHDLHRRRDGVGLVEDHLRQRHRDVVHERRVDHVSEIDDAGDTLPARVDQCILGAHVVVDHLGAQAGQPGQHPGLEALEEAIREAAALRILDVERVLAEPSGELEIPEEFMASGGMEEAPERAAMCSSAPVWKSRTAGFSAGFANFNTNSRPSPVRSSANSLKF